jgi:NAD(P)-dependent dehydrogenase (short-subunit alcohol dehydrogenase family)
VAPEPTGSLHGRVVVVTVDAADAAQAAASEGATVVIVGGGEAAGALASDIEAVGGRAAVFVGDLADEASRTALLELLEELFAEA